MWSPELVRFFSFHFKELHSDVSEHISHDGATYVTQTTFTFQIWAMVWTVLQMKGTYDHTKNKTFSASSNNIYESKIKRVPSYQATKCMSLSHQSHADGKWPCSVEIN